MKLKIQSLLLIVMLGTVIMSCNDDDEARDNAYVFDGNKKAIKSAIFEDRTYDEGGGYDLRFSAEEFDRDEEWNEQIRIQIPQEMMGSKFELTEERLYEWWWWMEFRNYEEEFYYSGHGSEGGMEDVKSGTMSATNKGDGNFEVEVDIVFTNGKTLKLYYSGNMMDWNEIVGRKSTAHEKNTSANK